MDPVKYLSCLPLAVLGYWLWGLGRRERHLPPGPPTKPVIGNIHLLPTSLLQLQFTIWAREYGAIFSLKVFNSTMIILSSPSAIRDVLDKTGSLTAGRPRSIMQLTTDGLHMAMESANTGVWRRARKAFQMFLTAEAVDRHLPTQEAESIQLLYDLLSSPEDLYTHIIRTTASLIASLAYGKRFPVFKGSQAEVYALGIKLVNQVNDTTKFPPVEILPWIKYIPRWLAPWTAHCDLMRSVRDTLYDSLVDECDEAVKAGRGTGCYIEKVLERQEELGLSRKDISYIGATLMDAGAETSASFLQAFVLALLTFPECQRRLQTEIDTIVGPGRMPNLADYETLPYMQAFVNELHRFRPLMPLALPHMASEDIPSQYKGYVIPKGSMLWMNTWSIMHDPDLFEDPETFRPERFFDNTYGTKPGVDTTSFRDNFAFGAGRRICPGERMGRRTTALNAMNLVWSFDFSPLNRKESFDLGMDRYLSPGLELAPKPFVCDVKVRDNKRAAMIRSAYSANQ
ncbi:putative cytochrome P450 monooxygenase [Phlegmacium glaucopus]|nr:putative cytochrome P450 monooxygenase [Phlegmacium glaucopus]